MSYNIGRASAGYHDAHERGCGHALCTLGRGLDMALLRRLELFHFLGNAGHRRIEVVGVVEAVGCVAYRLRVLNIHDPIMAAYSHTVVHNRIRARVLNAANEPHVLV